MSIFLLAFLFKHNLIILFFIYLTIAKKSPFQCIQELSQKFAEVNRGQNLIYLSFCNFLKVVKLIYLSFCNFLKVVKLTKSREIVIRAMNHLINIIIGKRLMKEYEPCFISYVLLTWPLQLPLWLTVPILTVSWLWGALLSKTVVFSSFKSQFLPLSLYCKPV